MTPQELKNSILQLAIQGKLVEQRLEEGTAEELYQQIQAEKKKLIKEGKIKKEKPLPEITEEEKPFDIPDSWIWVRLAHIWSVLNGDRGKNYPAKSTLSHIGIPFISALNLNGETVVIDDNLLCLSEDQYNKLGNGKLLLNDIVLCIRGSLGKHGRYPFTEGAIASSLVIMRQSSGYKVLDDYLMLYLDAPAFFQEIKKYDNGTAQPNLAAKSLEQFLIPIPPLAEQQRIVAKIEELLPLIDRYEKAWSRLEEFNKRFPDDMQKSILQMAIQGKLVEQRPEEGTGEELYQQIQAEKQRLIKEGKIKKEKPLPEITEEEKPFDIPDSWIMIRLSQVALTIVDCPHSTPHYYESETRYTAIDTNCIDSDGNIIAERYVDQTTYFERIQRLVPQGNDIVYTREGSICRAAILPDEKKICLGQRVMLIRCPNGVSAKYIKMILMAPQTVIHLTAKQKGIGAKHVNVADVCQLPIPLPPTSEQERIVAKINETLPLCSMLRKE